MEKTLTIIARVLSAVFTPLMTGTYAMILALWLSYLSFTPLNVKAIVLAITFAGTCIIPVIAIFALWKAGVVKDPGLNNSTDRTIPYLVTLAGFLAVCVYTRIVNAPLWLTLFYAGAAVSLLIDTIVNRKWKISGHMTGMGGLCAMLFYMMISDICIFPITLEFLGIILLTGMVGTARLLLERHTLWQVAAGFACGFCCTLALPLIFA